MQRFFPLFILVMLVVSCSGKKKETENVLNVYSREVVSTLDPMLVTDTYSVTVVRQVYEGLYEYHYLKLPYEMTPVLADGMPVVSDNGLTYIIKMKKGVRFIDDACFKSTGGKGREVTAHDFIYTVKRYISSPYAETFTFVKLMTDIIVGLDDYKKKLKTRGVSAFSENIEGIQATDDYTLLFKLKKTSIYFPSILARPWSFIVPREAVEYYGSDFVFHPVGTGPFRLVEWDRGTKLVLEKNKSYRHFNYPSSGNPEYVKKGYLNDAGRELPFLDKVVIHILVEEQPRWLNFVRGTIDIVVPDKDNYYDAFPVGTDLSAELVKKGVKLINELKLEYRYYAFNMSDPVLGKNKYLRQAISLAYDSEKHNALFFNDNAVVANWIIPPGISFGYDPDFTNKYGKYDAEAARQLLVKAGFPDGNGLPVFTLVILDSIAARQVGEFFVKSMAAIGIKIRLESRNFGELLKQINEGRDFQIFTLAWRADFPFAEDFLRQLYGKAFSPGPNHSLFSNAEYNRLYEKALGMEESPKKLAVLNRMRDIAVEECVIIPVLYPRAVILTQPYVENYIPHMLMGDMYKFVRLDFDKKREMRKIFSDGRL
ncbi:MAG: hypothetical protein JXA66_06555 [Oligoflexia bacterium]|nr:hypothetical protein [Oligoflexia bacterium]